jgi:hypothetical protein
MACAFELVPLHQEFPMRTIQLHPLSVLVGLGIATLAFVAMAQSPTPIDPVLHPRSLPQPVIAARDMVQIKEGTPFVVPASKILVITGLGRRTYSLNGVAQLSIDGVVEAEVTTGYFLTNGGYSASDTASIKALPVGLSVHEGSTVAVSAGNTDARAWGYLADA